MHEIRFNLALSPCDNPAFRKAMQHATDRQKLLDVIFAGAGVASHGAPITPALTFWANPDIKMPEPSIDLARSTLKDAGFSWDGNGQLLMPAAATETTVACQKPPYTAAKTTMTRCRNPVKAKVCPTRKDPHVHTATPTRARPPGSAGKSFFLDFHADRSLVESAGRSEQPARLLHSWVSPRTTR